MSRCACATKPISTANTRTRQSRKLVNRVKMCPYGGMLARLLIADETCPGSIQHGKENSKFDANILEPGSSDPQTPLKVGCASLVPQPSRITRLID